MGGVFLHENPDPEKQALERALAFNALSDTDKIKRLLTINALAVKLNGGKPLKQPQGKGIIIRKPKK